MDQDAFRNMLASGSGASSSTTNRSRGVLGGSAPKRGGWGIKAKPGHEYKAAKDDAGAGFVPRSQKKKGKDVKDEAGSKYMDRAARRRLGLDDEYKPVEQLLEDLERRQKEEGVDQEEIDKQRAYLGGDATHSILVKGLDHALLARRKAELAAQGEEIADEELDALVTAAGSKSKQPAIEAPKAEEKMAKGFKSISAKDKVEGKPKKKKKKKVKPSIASGPSSEVKVEPEHRPVTDIASKPEPSASSKPSTIKPPSPPPIDDDEDIFGDVGAYDLTNGRPEDSDSDSEEDDTQLEHAPSRSRSRSRSGSRSIDDTRRERRYRSPSRDRYGYRQRSRSRDRHYHRDDDRYRSRSRDGIPRRDRSDSRDRYERRRPSYLDDRDQYDARDRYDSRDRRRRDSIDRYDRDPRYERRSERYGSAEARTGRRSRSASRSPPPAAKRPRLATRSPSPILFDPHARMPSPTPSASDDDEHLVNGKLQPLQSSAIADVKGYLSAEAAALKAEEKKAKKAKWRARQGLALQEGTEGYLEREVGDKEKLNRDYVKVMGKLKKDEDMKES